MAEPKKAALGFIFVTLLIDVIGIGLIIPVMPKLIMGLSGVTNAEAGGIGNLMVAVFGLMQFIFSPVIGNLSDRFGRRPVLLASLFGFGVDYIFMIFAPTIGWLFVGRAVAGIMGASFTTASAYIADVSTPEKRAQNFGMIGVAFGLGFIMGPFLGGVLAEYGGSRAPFAGAAILTMLNWLYGFFVLPESLPVENRRKFDWRKANPFGAFKFLWQYKVILGLVASILLIYLAAHAVQSTWPYFTAEKFQWSTWDVSVSLTCVGLMVALVQGLLIRFIIPKIGQSRSVYLGLALYAVGFFLFAIATQGWMMYAILVPYCLGGIAGPALQGIMSGQVPATEQGELQGALTGLISITSVAGPLMMGGIFYYFSKPGAPVYFPGAAMMTGAVLTVVSVFLARLNLKKHRDSVPHIH
jgi:DHA1 family tetracycline resistance protein-like MFS transporter